MISELNQQSALIDEHRLGSTLNQCVHQGNRSEFSLLLAMLDEDVRFHAQFTLPQKDEFDHIRQTNDLRRFFDLPEPAPIALTAVEQISDFEQAEMIEKGRLSDLRLQDALHPKPLAFRDDKLHIPTSVLTNTSIHCQHKTKTKSETKRSEFNAEGWLKNIQNTLVQSTLFELTA
ncbi:VC2046/SO_2500 family protein [Thalassotalea fusca]